MLLMTLISAFTITGAVSSCVAWPASLLLGLTAGSKKGGFLALAALGGGGTDTGPGGGGTDTGNSQTEPDTTAPYIIGSTPSDGATAVAPKPGTITVVFNEAMDTGLTPTLTVGLWKKTNSQGVDQYEAISTAGTTFTWTNPTTLTITLGVGQFLENTEIRWTLGAANLLKDTAGNVMENDVTRTFTTNSRNSYFTKIADTGQTDCYNDQGKLKNGYPDYGCGNTSYPRQDAAYVNIPHARSFTGPTAHDTYTSDYTTKDNVTGLVWKTCSERQQYQNGSCKQCKNGSCKPGYPSPTTWYAAVNACAGLNNANNGNGYAERTDWRLPTSAELESLIDYGNGNPAIDTKRFPGTMSAPYWTSTVDPTNQNNVILVNFQNGRNPTGGKMGPLRFVRCVSGPVSDP